MPDPTLKPKLRVVIACACQRPFYAGRHIYVLTEDGASFGTMDLCYEPFSARFLFSTGRYESTLVNKEYVIFDLSEPDVLLAGGGMGKISPRAFRGQVGNADFRFGDSLPLGGRLELWIGEELSARYSLKGWLGKKVHVELLARDLTDPIIGYFAALYLLGLSKDG